MSGPGWALYLLFLAAGATAPWWVPRVLDAWARRIRAALDAEETP